jgi:hypothetical protein
MTQAEGPGRLRASDAEREQVATILRAAVTEGRLDLDEGDQRQARAYAAIWRDDLRPLTADLPDDGRRALWNTPQASAALRRRLRIHTAATLVAAGALVGAWELSGARFFWPLVPLLFLGFSLLRHRRIAHAWRAGGWPAGPPWADRGRRWAGPGRAGQAWDGGDWRGGVPRGRGQW